MIRRERAIIDVLIVGADSPVVRSIHQTVREKAGWDCVISPTTVEAERFLAQRQISLTVVCVENASSLRAALSWLGIARTLHLPAVVVHGDLTAADVLELLRAGAVECLSRPLNLSRLSLVLDLLAAPRLAANASRTHAGNAAGDDSSAGQELLESIQELESSWKDSEHTLEQLRAVAPLDTTVTITGETGTGKTRLSRLIHALSPRANRPMVAVNCGACTESLLESEFFGHVRGAFTGADRDQAGKFAQAEDGTLLLDEIDALSLAAQVKLLHVVEERVFQPVGGTKAIPMRARLVVASNRNLESEVAAGRFRADLFYRLNVVSFHLPPLRDRAAEIEPLAERFAEDFAKHHGLRHTHLAQDAVRALLAYQWPGNIRELRNVIERAVILSAGRPIAPDHLPRHIVASQDARGDAVSERIDERMEGERGGSSNKLVQARVSAERDELLEALKRNEQNRTRTALDLGISRMALYKRMRKFRLL